MGSPTASDRRLRRCAVALAVVVAAVAPAMARADGKALAQSLFDRARVLMDQGQFGEACPLLAESQKLDPGGGTLLNIAVCWEGAGRLATANEAFHEALGQSIKDQRTDRKAIAEEHIAGIAPRLSTLAVDVPAAVRVADLVVRVDGTQLSMVTWGVPAAVDGGEHQVEASAPGYAPWSTTVRVAGERDTARATVPALAPQGQAAPGAAPSPPPIGRSQGSRVCPPGMRVAGDTCEREAEPRAHWSTATWVTGGVGLGLVAIGAIAGGAALAQDAKASETLNEAGCNAARNYCPAGSGRDEAQTISDEAETWGWVSTGAFIAGGATVLVALLLPRELDGKARPIAIVPGPGTAGLGLRLPLTH